jgi:signal transduction histidine kinase
MRALAGSAQSKHVRYEPVVDGRRPVFENLRRIAHVHVLATDALMAGALLAVSTAWLVWSGAANWRLAVVQLALIVPLVWRRSHPGAVFALISAIALAQWLLGYRLIGDAALLIALYTVAVHESRVRSLVATSVMEVGALMAATRWRPAATAPRSFLFLTATVVAALFAGFTVRSGSEYMGWLAERAERLEIERDQQASIGAAAERTRIAREMHDIVAHSLSVVVTLADAAALVSRSDPARSADAMGQVSTVGRQALTDMRTLIGVLRTESSEAELAPLPSIAQLDDLLDGVRATGLDVTVERIGQPFPLGAALELSIFRIVQEALTNALKHASATTARISLRYDRPAVQLEVEDNGSGASASAAGEAAGLGAGHGIAGMRERASLYGGSLRAGPASGGGWAVSATLFDTAPEER